MKISETIFKVVLVCVLSIPLVAASAYGGNPTPGFNHKIPEQIMTPDRVETRIGELEFFDGMPTDATIDKVYETLDLMRGVDVFLNFIPAASMEAMRMGMVGIGADRSNRIMIFDTLMDSNTLFLTANTDTVYACVIMDLEKDGPTVVEIPAGAGPGTVNDAFFRFVVDMGSPGPDKQKGGTYIILPPDYKGDMTPTPNTLKEDTPAKVMIGGKMQDAWIAQSRSFNNWLILRGFLVDGKPDAATKMWKEELKIYPLSKAQNPPGMEHVNASKKVFNTIHANNYEFFKELDHVIQKEPVDFIDPELRGQAAAIGIIKGKKFNPDARMKQILTDSVAVGNATARAIWLKPRDKKAFFFDDRQWYSGFIGGDYRWLDIDGMRGRNMDARTLFFYFATVNTPAMVLEIPGVGSNYAQAARDKNGNYLDGSKTYKLNMPANVPAKDFWSIVLYDPQTRSMLQTSQAFPSINNKIDKLDYNKDGSVDLYFGPRAPKGKKANWIQTVPGKGWFTLLRLYGPLESWFDRSWKPGDFELVNE